MIEIQASGKNTINIITHNGVFHADEVFACGLIEVFKGTNLKIIRTRDQKTIEAAKQNGDFIIDVGGQYNGKNLFDHHHDQKLKSSAGLIWESLGLQDQYPLISELVDIIDQQDLGIKMAGAFELPNIIKRLNGAWNEQDENFKKAVLLVIDIIISMKAEQEELERAKAIVENAMAKESPVEGVLELEEFTMKWSSFVNSQKTPHIRAVMWQDPHTGEQKAQVVPVQEGSMEFSVEGFEPDPSMTFVHKNKFFCVAKDRETMIKYLS